MSKEVHVVIHRDPGDYGYGPYDSVEIVTLDFELALKYIEDYKHDYNGNLFIENHILHEEIKKRKISKKVELEEHPSFTTNEKESKEYGKQSMEIILKHKIAIRDSIIDLLYNISGNDHNKRMLLILLNIQDTISALKEIQKNFKKYFEKKRRKEK